MYYLVLLFAAAALLSGGRSASVSRHMKLLAEMDNHIESNAPSKLTKPSPAVPIKVSSAKKFIALTRKPPAIAVHERGATLELVCEALAAPAPSIHWFRNDAPVYELDQESNEVLESNPTSLARISSTLLVTRPSSRHARYTCVIVAGRNKTMATSIVISSDGSTDTSERSKLVPLAPRILVSYKVLVDVIGTTVVLPCRARGHPRPRVVWTNQNSTLVTKDPRMKVLRSGELVISGLRWADLGEYRCRADNMFGTAHTTTFLYPAKPNNTNG